MGAPGNTGLAHKAAIAAGASTDLMDQAWWSPGLIHPDGRAAFALCFTGGIFVDKAGRRFVNESAAYDRLGREILAAMRDGTVDTPYWMVYDSRAGEQPPVMATNVSFSPTSEYEAAGLWVQADTLEELADKIGVPEGNLVETVRRFNELAQRGDDEDFGRGRESFDRAFTGGRRRWCRSTRRRSGLRHSARLTSAPRAGCAPTSMRACWTPKTGPFLGFMRRGTRWPRCPVRPTRAAATPSGRRCCSVTVRHCTWRGHDDRGG